MSDLWFGILLGTGVTAVGSFFLWRKIFVRGAVLAMDAAIVAVLREEAARFYKAALTIAESGARNQLLSCARMLEGTAEEARKRLKKNMTKRSFERWLRDT